MIVNTKQSAIYAYNNTLFYDLLINSIIKHISLTYRPQNNMKYSFFYSKQKTVSKTAPKVIKNKTFLYKYILTVQNLIFRFIAYKKVYYNQNRQKKQDFSISKIT